MVDFKAKVQRVLFPKTPIKAGCYAILSVKVEKGYDDIYRDEKWGTTVIKGRIPLVDTQTVYNIKAEFVEDPKFGKQYQIISISDKDNKLEDNQEGRDFLKILLTEKQYENLTNGTDTPIALLESGNIEEISSIKGFGEKTAKKLLEKYNANKGASADMLMLSKYDLTDFEQKVLLRSCSGNALIGVQKLKEDPYWLTSIKGFGFRRVDDIALRNNLVTKKDKRRVKAYIVYLFEDLANTIGSTWVSTDELFDVTMDILEIDTHEEYLIKEALNEMLNDNIIWTDKRRTRIALTKYRDMEKEIAYHFHRLATATPTLQPCENWRELISYRQKQQGWNYNKKQLEAIERNLNNSLVITLGRAGTGKSSSIEGTLVSFGKDMKLAQCCLSGKASDNLKSLTGKEAMTIHRLLKMNPENGSFEFNEKKPLDVNVVIADEFGMNNLNVTLALLRAIPTGCRVYLLGDTAQVPSVGVGAVFQNAIDSETLPINIFDKVMRQGAGSKIKELSFDIADGKSIFEDVGDYTIEERDLKIHIREDRTEFAQMVLEEYIALETQYDIKDIAVISPIREKGDCSCYNINNMIQKYLFKGSREKYILAGTQEYPFKIHVGDRVLNNKNNYYLRDYYIDYSDMTEKQIKEFSVPIYNGQTGTVVKILDANSIVVEIDNGNTVIITKDELKELTLGYCISLYKSQGSTIPYTILVWEIGAYKLLNRNVLYTGFTRTKNYGVVIAQRSALKKAISEDGTAIRDTFLTELLKYNFKD